MACLVNFVAGPVLKENGENLIFNRLNAPIPRKGDMIVFPKKYLGKVGGGVYIVEEVLFQFQNEEEDTFVWVFTNQH